MKIKKQVITESEVEISFPSYYKRADLFFSKLINESIAITVCPHDDFLSIGRESPDSIFSSNGLIPIEITASKFDEAYVNATGKINKLLKLK